ncbi:Alpha/Beta hydrolase protein [Schizophyllum commune]
MGFAWSILALASIAAVGARSVPGLSAIAERDSSIKWRSCGELDDQYGVLGDPLNITCGYYEVPLEWADESVGTAKLAVAIYPATKSRKGAMFANPGGPGGSGVEYILEYGHNISAMTGGHYDIVSWDPRGVGHSTPGPPTCFDSDDDWEALFNGTLEVTGIEIRGNLTDGDQIDELYSHVDEMEEKYKTLGESCAKAESGKTLPYLGSAAGARDMVAMAEYFDPGVQEINYWGVSYGSMLGFIFVNMFPDRVGHVILDGCMNPILYTSKPTTDYFPNDVETTDEAFAGFATGCAMAGKGSCKLAKSNNDTAADITKYVQDMFDLAHDLLESGADLSSSLTSAQARAYLYSSLYMPAHWSELDDIIWAIQESLEDIAAGNSTSVKRELEHAKRQLTESTHRSIGTGTAKRQISEASAHTYALEAIYCGDGVDAGNMTMRGAFDSIVYASENVSPMFGPLWGVQGNVCFAWPARAVERYTGPWNKKLKNPILVIGNTADPVTPFENAKLMADLLGDSAVLLKQDGFGHSSLAEKSTCTINIIKKYFKDGSLPSGDDTQCEIDDSVVLFPDSDVTQAGVKASLLAAAGNTATDGANASPIDEKLKDVESERDKFRTATIAVSAAAGVLLLALIASILRSARERRKYARVNNPTREGILDPAWSTNAPSRHSFTDPYDNTYEKR